MHITKGVIEGLEPVDKLNFYIENSETLKFIDLNLANWKFGSDEILGLCSSCCKVGTLEVLILNLPVTELLEGTNARSMLNVILKK